ncbi:MAG: hypothetical protein PHV74_11660 [Dehalococcoidia bacterium]|nr:hypothetical protein [Dehalococcoidia bacterium]
METNNSSMKGEEAGTPFGEIISEYVGAVIGACGLDINQAKTVVYYAVVTHAMEKSDIMPVMVIMGPQGTGKSSLIEMIQKFTCRVYLINGRISYAELRDSLKPNTTALIEEADRINENLILGRYSRRTSATSVKRGGAAIGYKSEGLDLFGATVLHRRVPFKDAALDSRSIIIMTRYKPGTYSMPEIDGQKLKEIAEHVEWDKGIGLPSGRIKDTWEPLMRVAWACVDGEWIIYAYEKITEGEKNLTSGQGYEPVPAVIMTLNGMFYQDGIQLFSKVQIAEVRGNLKEHYGVKLNNRQIEQICRIKGFNVTNTHGYPTVHCDDALLDQLMNEIDRAE